MRAREPHRGVGEPRGPAPRAAAALPGDRVEPQRTGGGDAARVAPDFRGAVPPRSRPYAAGWRDPPQLSVRRLRLHGRLDAGALHRARGAEDPRDRRSGAAGDVGFVVQGTLYPDVIESASPFGGPSVTIKTHHNVGGLRPALPWKLIEPLRELFKDEVRQVGRELGLPEELVGRHPFPGPGLAIRVLGAVTGDRLDQLRRVDAIYIDEIRAAGLYDQIWQAFAVLLPIKSVGVMGDGRTYDHVVALRAVTSRDGMTADWFPFPPEVLARISSRVINEVKGVNRVTYDVSSKPPATIEWE